MLANGENEPLRCDSLYAEGKLNVDSDDDEEEVEEEEEIPLSFEDKMVGFISNTIGPSVRNQRILGLVLMAAAGVFLTLGNVLVQYVYRKSPVKISSFEVLFLRSLIQAFFTLFFMIFGKVHPYGERKNILPLISMGIAEVAAIIFVYLALERMPVSDATVIQFTAPVFTVFFSFLLLRKGCSCFDTVVGLVSFFGVVIIAKPDLIIHKSDNVMHHHKHDMQDKTFTHQYLEGALFALLAAMCLSLFFILNKLNGLKLDVTLTVMYPSVFGMIVAPIAMAALKQKVTTDLHSEYWGILIAVGFLCFVGLMFMAEALQLEDAGPAVLIRNCDVIYAFILQFLLMHVAPTVAAIIGTVIVLGCSSLIALNRVFHLQQKCFGDRFDCKCCEKKSEIEDEEETHFMLRNAADDEE